MPSSARAPRGSRSPPQPGQHQIFISPPPGAPGPRSRRRPRSRGAAQLGGGAPGARRACGSVGRSAGSQDLSILTIPAGPREARPRSTSTRRPSRPLRRPGIGPGASPRELGLFVGEEIRIIAHKIINIGYLRRNGIGFARALFATLIEPPGPILPAGPGGRHAPILAARSRGRGGGAADYPLGAPWPRRRPLARLAGSPREALVVGLLGRGWGPARRRLDRHL
jgi:hypothetical protein